MNFMALNLILEYIAKASNEISLETIDYLVNMILTECMTSLPFSQISIQPNLMFFKLNLIC